MVGKNVWRKFDLNKIVQDLLLASNKVDSNLAIEKYRDIFCLLLELKVRREGL